MPPRSKGGSKDAKQAADAGPSGKVAKAKKAPGGGSGGGGGGGGGSGGAGGSSKAMHEAVHDKANEIKELEERRRQMTEQLHHVETQIYNLESQYIDKANPRGNAIKGYDGLLLSLAAGAKKASLKQEDRIFSNSSVTGTTVG